uniref:AGC-kinase C-terminal domain-containing protein n=1 Tax=Timema bartmani TaxID=61472 RepID=A0A7R9F9U9_9NEOP|nr:unnamed protein product [Timema bartmani]
MLQASGVRLLDSISKKQIPLCTKDLLGTRDSDYCNFTTVLEEEVPITGNNDSPALPNLIYIRRKSDHGKPKNDNALLQKDSSKRLGTQESGKGEVMDQPFFRKIDWNALERRELIPPFKPRVQHPLDVQYFDKTFTAERAKLTPVEKNILESMDQTQFQGFSYTNPNATD